MNIASIDEFPTFYSINHTTYFQEQITYLFLNLTRKTDPLLIENIAVVFRDVLRLLKTELHIHRKTGLGDKAFQYLESLKMIYALIANTRDVFKGKGEHDLFYMMIYELYLVFPTLAVYMLYQIEKYGCWRDIKYLCHYIRVKSSKKEEDRCIGICIAFMNKQLKKDIESWKFSIHAGSRNHISNIAKWIPREKKAFDWLFEKLAVHWSNHYARWKICSIDINDSSYIPALIKCKQQYRKIISRMNKNLDTTEIKFCAQRWDEIDPNKVSKHTIMKQPQLFLSHIREQNCISNSDIHKDIAKKKCSQNYLEKTNSLGTYFFGKHCIIQLPISYFIKEAFRLVKSESGKNNLERELLNKKWQCFSKQHNYALGNTLPMIDISFKMLEKDAETFYTAIGLALLVAERSLFGKRILSLENMPTWINLQDSNDLCSSIEIIERMIRSEQNTAFSFEKGIDFLIQAFIETKSIIRNMKLILFSNNMSGNIDHYYEYVQKNYGIFELDSPILIFWNLSKTDLCDLPECKSHVGLFSGFSSYLLKYMKEVVFQNETYSYKLVCKILRGNQYHFLMNYIDKIAGN